MRNQDLKNILTDKLQTWLGQPHPMASRQVALGIAPTANKRFEPAALKGRKEFISPKKLGHPEDRSPCLGPQLTMSNIDEDQNLLRKGSSQILSGAGSMRGGGDFRDRSDSMSAFKKYEKLNNDISPPMSNPMFSPAVHPQATNQNTLTLSGLLGPQTNPNLGSSSNNMTIFQHQLIQSLAPQHPGRHSSGGLGNN